MVYQMEYQRFLNGKLIIDDTLKVIKDILNGKKSILERYPKGALKMFSWPIQWYI